jgi:hypothetical protein
MKKIKIYAVCMSFLAVFLTSCTKDEITGNGTQIGNPTIVGVIYQPDGKTPAQNATVCLRGKSSLIDIGLKKQKEYNPTVTTNAKGEFALYSVAHGTYVIECSDKNNHYALYDSVTIIDSTNSVTLPSDTLKPAGVIQGKINLSEGGDLNNIYVLVFGVQRFSVVDSNGNFTVNNLAEGNYKLRIISNLKDYDLLDTSMISVVSNDTTKLTISLPFTGIPTVKNLTSNYDTLSRKVTLSWNTVDTSNILGFNVYRCEKYELNADLMRGSQNPDSTKLVTNPLYTKLTRLTPAKGFSFVDSTGTQNLTYIYKVSAVRKDSAEGSKSEGVTVRIATYFTLDTIFNGRFIDKEEIKGWDPTKFIYKNGSFYIVSDSGIRVFDTLFNRTALWSNVPQRPFEIAADNNGQIYVSCVDTSKDIVSINIYAPSGTLNRKITLKDSLDTTSIEINATLFTVSKNGHIILVNSDKDSIFICDTAGSIIKKVGGFYNARKTGQVKEGITNITTDQLDNLYVYEYNAGIKVFNADGVLQQTIATPSLLYGNSISVDPENGYIFFSVGGSLSMIYTPDGKTVRGVSTVNGELQNIIVLHNKIYIAQAQFTYNIGTSAITTDCKITKLTNNLPSIPRE